MTYTKLESAKLAPHHHFIDNKDSVKQMHEIFPEWSFEDLAIVLSELGGDMETAVQRISEGFVEPWSKSVKKTVKKEQEEPQKSFKRHQVKPRHGPKDGPRHKQADKIASPQTPREELVPEKKEESTTVAQTSTGVQEQPRPPKVTGKPSMADVVSGKIDTLVPKPKVIECEAAVAPVAEVPKALTQPQEVKATRKGAKVVRYRSIKKTDEVPVEQALIASVEYQNVSSANSVALSPESSSAPVESSINNMVAKSSEAPLPVVQMPSKLSSRLASSHALDPVVIMPPKVNVRAEKVTTMDKEREIGGSKIMSTRYTTASVEAFLDPSSHSTDEKQDVLAPVQRQARQNLNRDSSFMTSPPGLASQDYLEDRSSPIAQSKPMRYHNYTSYREETDSQPQLSNYYPQQQSGMSQHYSGVQKDIISSMAGAKVKNDSAHQMSGYYSHNQAAVARPQQSFSWNAYPPAGPYYNEAYSQPSMYQNNIYHAQQQYHRYHPAGSFSGNAPYQHSAQNFYPDPSGSISSRDNREGHPQGRHQRANYPFSGHAKNIN